jgi:small nuclear ribonucleoprotein (snRNP)-like protein
LSQSPSNNKPDAQPLVTSPQAAAIDKLGLEDIVHLANKVGLEYVTARKEAERLDLLKNTVKARVSIRLDDGRMSEAKLRRVVETDDEYLQFIDQLVQARAEAERLKIRYDSYRNLFDARRSLLSYQKAEMKLV